MCVCVCVCVCTVYIVCVILVVLEFRQRQMEIEPRQLTMSLKIGEDQFGEVRNKEWESELSGKLINSCGRRTGLGDWWNECLGGMLWWNENESMDGMRMILCQWNKNEPLLQVWKGSWSGHTVHIKKLVAKDDVFSSQTVQETFPREYPKLRYAKTAWWNVWNVWSVSNRCHDYVYNTCTVCVYVCWEGQICVYETYQVFSIVEYVQWHFNKTKCEVHYTGSELKLIVILISQFTLSWFLFFDSHGL